MKVYFQSTSRPIWSLMSLKVLEEKRLAKRFMRIHRSYIISPDQMKALIRNSVQIGEVAIWACDQYKETFSTFINRWINERYY